jgi:hypothetical protein
MAVAQRLAGRRAGRRNDARKGPRLLLLLVLALVAVTVPALAREEFRSYDVAIVMASDGSLEVTETIAANVEGDTIRHGLYRDLPRTIVGDDGSINSIAYDVASVERNGNPEVWRVEDLGTSLRVWMGNPDVLLDPAVHTFALRYVVTGASWASKAGGNSFAWEPVNGGWAYPVLATTFRIVLPDGARIVGLAARVGTARDEKAGSWKRLSPREAIFTAAQLPGAGKALGIVIRFDGGLVRPARQGAST